MIKNKNKYSSIFQNYLNKDNSKLNNYILKRNEVGNNKYFPPFFQGSHSILYTYNTKNTKYLPSHSVNINNMINKYFDMHINLFNEAKASLNKIFISKPEVKFTNKKLIITIYTYNKEKLNIIRKIRKLRRSTNKKIIELIFKTNKLFTNVNSELNKKIIKTFLYEELMILYK
jgi:hypothetical protein